MKHTTVGIDTVTHSELKKLSKIHKQNMMEFLRHAIIYFKRTGINPEQSELESPQKAIRELSKRVEQIIGVIKTQEQEKINPLLETLLMLTRRAETILNDAPKESTFKSILSQTEKMMEEDQKNYTEQLKNQHKFYSQQNELLQKGYAEQGKKLDDLSSKVDKMTELLEKKN